MKSVKRILSSILVITMLLVMVSLPVSAAISSQADTVRILGVLKGDSAAGVTEEYLAKNTNRSQGARILLRLMGLETEADAFTGSATFSDASNASSYWQHMLAYLKANPEVGFQGYPDGTFKPLKVMTAQEIYKVLLTSLGYVQDVDYTWDEVFTFAAEKGLTALYGTEEITNDDLATALVEALNATKKDGMRLINFLVQEGVVTSTKAAEAGFLTITELVYEETYLCIYNGTPDWPSTLEATFADETTGSVNVVWSSIDSSVVGFHGATGTVEGYGTISVIVEVFPETLTVMDAFPSDADEITVLVNQPVPIGTTITLKRGLVGLGTTVTYSENRKSFTFTQTWNFTPGEYTVNVGGSEKTFTIEAERAEGLYIDADYIYPLANQDLQIHLVNQYGMAMNLTNVQITISNITKGIQVPYTITGETAIANGSDPSKVEAGDQLMIFVLHNTSMLTATKQVVVYDEPSIQALQFGTLEIADNKSTIVEYTTGHKIEVYAIDQYGNPLMLTNADIQPGGLIQVYSTSETIINPASIIINGEGDLVFNAEAPGIVTLHLIVPTKGIIAQQTLTVYASSAIDNFIIAGATGRVTAGTTADLISQAYDQYGTPLSLLGNFEVSKLVVSSSNPSVVPNNGIIYDAGTGTLQVMAGIAGTAQVFYSYDGSTTQSFSVTVDEAPRPVTLVSSNIPSYFQVGAIYAATDANLVIKDQYGEAIDLEGTGYTVSIEFVNGTGTYMSSSPASFDGTNTVTFTASSTAGTANVQLSLLNSSMTSVSVIQPNVYVLNASEITNYTLSDAPILYGAPGTAGTDYEVTLEIQGKTSTGQTVILEGSGAVPSGIIMVTNSNSADFTLNNTTLELSAQAAGTTTIKIFSVYGEEDAITVTAVSDLPEVTIFAWNASEDFEINEGQTAVALLEGDVVVKDQYGVVIDLTSGSWYTSIPAAISIATQSTNKSPTVTIGTVTTDTAVSISYITTDGKVLTHTFTVVDD
ncbi:MAG: hypothetical protein KAG94_03220 [Clostridiales bacterium]|nr:hypothetical protein [Clostridiales bacterium]